MLDNQYFDKVGVILCLRGSRHLLINGKPYTQKEGMLLIVSPLFVIQQTDLTADYAEHFISAEPHVVFSILNRISQIVINLHIINHPCFEINRELFDSIESNVERIMNIKNKRDSSNDSDEKAVYNIMIEKIVEESILSVALFLYQKSGMVGVKETANENVLFDFVMQLQSGMMSDRSVAYYAEKANLSVGYFSSIIRKTAGISPSRIIAAFTIAHAKIMLNQTKKSIKEISSEMNFPEQYTFRKYFKHYTGMAPTAYRDSIIKEKRY